MQQADMLKDYFWRSLSFLRYVAQRFREDRCLQAAASLSYTSVLALVPLVTISFAIFAAFPAFQDYKDQVQALLVQSLTPQAVNAIWPYFDGFVQNTQQLPLLGTLFLLFTAVMLLSVIENTFNILWRVPQRRSLLVRFLAFWAVLTLGPLLIAASLSLSAVLQEEVLSQLPAVLSPVLGLVPFLVTLSVFVFLYMVMPHAKVRFAHALVGGTVAAISFELSKDLFGVYLQTFNAYETIYGALAVIPMTLIWLYVFWAIVLSGCIVTASLAARYKQNREEDGD